MPWESSSIVGSKHNVGVLQELVLLPNGWWLDFDSLLTSFWAHFCQWEVCHSLQEEAQQANVCGQVWRVEARSKRPNEWAQLALYGTGIRPANSLRTRMHYYHDHVPMSCASEISGS